MGTCDCSNTQITNLDHLPSGLKELYCFNTPITNLDHLPPGLKELYCSYTQITSLDHLPPGLQVLNCSGIQITNLDHLPSGLQDLNCYNTQITNLDHLPPSLKRLYCSNCPLTEEYKGKTLPEIHLINRKKSFLRGICLVRQILAASKIQKAWKTYWYETLDSDGCNRFCLRSIQDLR